VGGSKTSSSKKGEYRSESLERIKVVQVVGCVGSSVGGRERDVLVAIYRSQSGGTKR